MPRNVTPAPDSIKHSIVYVASSGGVGGVLSCAYIAAMNQSPSMAMWQFIPVSMLLGAGAGFIGVFLLANTDRQDVARLLAFSMVCGFMWKPVYDAASSLIDKKNQENAESTTIQKAKAANEELKKAGSGEEVKRAAEKVIGLRQDLGRLSPDANTELTNEMGKFVTNLQRLTEKFPKDGTEALVRLSSPEKTSIDIVASNAQRAVVALSNHNNKVLATAVNSYISDMPLQWGTNTFSPFRASLRVNANWDAATTVDPTPEIRNGSEKKGSKSPGPPRVLRVYAPQPR